MHPFLLHRLRHPPGRLLCAALCFFACVAPPLARAQQPLAHGPAGQVSAAEVLADAPARIPAEARAALLARPATVGQLATNIYLQRAMAQEAERLGLTQGPQAAAALTLAREQAAAQLYLADFERRHQPDDAALLAYAQASYRAADARQYQAGERSRVRHILLREKTPQTRARIEQLLRDAQAGQDFAQLAREHSQDSASAARGGDLGLLTDGSTVAEFEQAVKALKEPGALSPVVETQFGYHIIRLEERRSAGKRGFDELRESLLEQARSALLREARVRDSQRLQQGMELDAAAVAAFAARHEAQQDRAP